MRGRFDLRPTSIQRAISLSLTGCSAITSEAKPLSATHRPLWFVLSSNQIGLLSHVKEIVRKFLDICVGFEHYSTLLIYITKLFISPCVYIYIYYVLFNVLL